MANEKKTDPATTKRVAERHAFNLFVMANFHPQDTGVNGVVVWVSVGEFAGAELQHGPRVKVVLGEDVNPEALRDAASVRLTDPPEVLGKLPGKIKRHVVEFIDRNRGTLLRYWNKELTAREMLDLIEKV